MAILEQSTVQRETIITFQIERGNFLFQMFQQNVLY